MGDTPPGVEPPRSRLRADRCDLLDTSAMVDLLPALSKQHRAVVSSEKLIFPNPPQGMDSNGSVNREDVSVYVKLVGWQLRSNKVMLFDSASARGRVFAVGKPTGAQREVWHGTRVLGTAVRLQSRLSLCRLLPYTRSRRDPVESSLCRSVTPNATLTSCAYQHQCDIGLRVLA